MGDLIRDRRIILRWVLRKELEDVYWVHVVQDRIQWPAFVNMVMNLVVPQEVKNFWIFRTSVSISVKALLYGIFLYDKTAKKLRVPISLR